MYKLNSEDNKVFGNDPESPKEAEVHKEEPEEDDDEFEEDEDDDDDDVKDEDE